MWPLTHLLIQKCMQQKDDKYVYIQPQEGMWVHLFLFSDKTGYWEWWRFFYMTPEGTVGSSQHSIRRSRTHPCSENQQNNLLLKHLCFDNTLVHFQYFKQNDGKFPVVNKNGVGLRQKLI